MTTNSVVLTISPSLNMDGRNAYSTRGQLFDGEVDGRPIVRRSTTPFCDAARALLADDVDPATVLVMRHAGSDHDALRSTVGTAAGLTVKDRGDGRPRLAKWRPNGFHGDRNDPGRDSMSETESIDVYPNAPELVPGLTAATVLPVTNSEVLP
jgi:hypothetical protein